ncbi:MAG: InlB B-repeat-containing protein, partial [Clostridiales bacterium]|nr:InlB B-repeat-containing protein [Clostridiales bacterium]
AQWSANSYTLTLDAGNGSVDPESITVTYDSAIGELPVATPADGYTFEGWCDEDGNEVTAETVYTTAGDSTIVAQYSTLDVPVLVSATNGLTGITVTWEAVDGAVQYQVLRRISTSSPWTAWEVVTVTSDTSYLDTDVTTGEIYRYTVACVAADGVTRTSLYNTSGVAVRWVAPTTAKAANQASGIQVTWTKVEGADGYMIYRKTANGSYKWIATIRDVDTLSYLDKNVNSGTDYTYSVRAFVSSTQSAYTVVGLWRLSEPELTLTTSTGSVTLSWNKVTGAEGYYVYRRTAGGAFERIATISSGSTVKFTDTTAVSGVHYYYAVRAYKSYTGSSYTAVDIVCK